MDPKKLALVLLEKRHGGEDDDGEEPSMPPLEDVMGEFIDAVKHGDAKAAAKAFRGAMACASDSDDDEGDDEETDHSY